MTTGSAQYMVCSGTWERPNLSWWTADRSNDPTYFGCDVTGIKMACALPAAAKEAGTSLRRPIYGAVPTTCQPLSYPSDVPTSLPLRAQSGRHTTSCAHTSDVPTSPFSWHVVHFAENTDVRPLDVPTKSRLGRRSYQPPQPREVGTFLRGWDVPG